MDDVNKYLQELTTRLNVLRSSQLQMQNEIRSIEEQLTLLKSQVSNSGQKKNEEITGAVEPEVLQIPVSGNWPELPKTENKSVPRKSVSQPIENFVGTNLISKAGILITIIGVFIGARYAIDKELISPATRMILAYVFAFALGITGLRLKAKFKAFSAILLGGGIAIIYFTTYIAYDYFRLLSLAVSFAMMLITTIGAVALALWYDQKVIAVIGQVAAYAIPILLSEGGGKAAVLFSYISIINAGLIVLSFYKNWKVVYRMAFALTWIMYFFWMYSGDQQSLSWKLTLVFLTICFITFYATYLSYKIFRKENYQVGEIAVLLLNGFFYYYLGYVLLDQNFEGTNNVTYFTVANALVHILAGFGIHYAKLADKSVRLFLFGQSLAFITIAIPVKLDGSWVTLLWSIESVIIMYIATRSNRKVYFQICAAVLLIALFSQIHDWTRTYSESTSFITPFYHQTFFISVITSLCMLFSVAATRLKNPLTPASIISKFFRFLLPLLLIITVYITFFLEIELYYDKLSMAHAQMSNHFSLLKNIALIIYTLIFCSVAFFVNNNFLKEKKLHIPFLIVGLIEIGVLLTDGLVTLGEMRSLYLLNHHPSWLSWVRYLSFAAASLLWLGIFKSRQIFPFSGSRRVFLSVAFNITLLTILCNEFLNWVEMLGYSNQYRLGLSIICGSYALALLFIGLMKQVKHLRIIAIVLFALIITKLFVYDLQSLTTIAKTIVMIILGVLLLAASFLYNKYISINAAKEN